MRPTPLVVLISGNGSTAQALMDHPRLDVRLVISTKDSMGLLRARRCGKPVMVVPTPLRPRAVRRQAEAWLRQVLESVHYEKIFLAGFMWVLSPDFIKSQGDRILNIHPSLLPKYPGARGFEDTLKAGDLVGGVTVHTVTAELDAGPMILQRQFAIPSHRNDQASKLWLHIQEARVLRDVARGGFRAG